MAEQFLDGANVVARFKQMRGKGMTKGVAADMLDYPGLSNCFLDSPLENRFVNVVSPLLPGLGVLPPLLLGECPLPPPVACTIRESFLLFHRHDGST